MTPAERAEANRTWADLLDEEKRLFTRLCELDRANPEKTPEKSRELRNWWRLANAILWTMTRTKAQHGVDLEPFPAFTLGRIAHLAEELSNGHVPTFVTDAAKGGRALWRKERHHIACAVLYVEGAKRGELQDRSPNKTVREIYGVTKTTVQQWLKNRDAICVGVPYSRLAPEQLAKKMRECGEIYRRIGRGIY